MARSRPALTKAEEPRPAPLEQPAGVDWCADPPAEEIRRRAYFLYLDRNGAAGDSLGDWVQAERELRQEAAWKSGRFTQAR